MFLIILSTFVLVFQIYPPTRVSGLEPYVITNDADPDDRYVLTTYTELQDKITELSANSKAYTLTLNQDLVVTGDNGLTFLGPSTWTVNGNNHTVEKEAGFPPVVKRVIIIGETNYETTVTLKNIIIDGKSNYMVCYVGKKSKLIMESGSIIQNGFSVGASGSTSGIHLIEDATLIMKPGSKLLGNHTEASNNYGGAVSVRRNCIVDIDGATISDNQTRTSGGAIWADHTAISVTIKNTTFSGNKAYNDMNQAHGGAIHSATYTIIDNCIFENNSAKNGGGAIFMARAQVSDNEELIVTNSTFSGNSAQYGGAISSHLKTTINGVKFENNTASSHGGAINLTNNTSASLMIEKSIFTKNKAIMGGALFTQNPTVTVIKNNTSFIENEAVREGGAIYTYNFSYANPVASGRYTNLNIDNTTTFKDNKATYYYDSPSNFADFTNLLFNTTSFTNQSNPHSGAAILTNDSLLNNNDINYKNTTSNALYQISYSFEDADGNALPQEVKDLLPAAGQAAEGSIFIPPVLSSNSVTLPNHGGTWTFVGWDNNQVNIPKDGIEFVGTWRYTAEATYTITYDGGPDATGVPVDNNQYYSGDTATVLEAPTRDGYKFLGWRMNPLLQPGEIITVSNVDIILTAEWEKITAVITPETGDNKVIINLFKGLSLISAVSLLMVRKRYKKEEDK
jgi:predicted outer membrane repeat protein